MGLNSAARITRLRQKLDESKIDGLFVSQPENRRYISGFDGSAGYLLITKEVARLATDFRYIEQSKRQAADFEVVQISGKTEKWFPALLENVRVKRLGFECDNVTVAFGKQLADAAHAAGLGLELVPVEGLVESLRTIKDREELQLISRAVAISDAAMSHIASFIEPGMTETQVAWEIEKFMRENGSAPVPFELLVQSGPNSALPHAQPSDRRISEGEPIVIDIGAKVEGYASDLTRTLCVGKPDDRFASVYDTVLGAQLTAIALIREGMTGQEADSFARAVIREAGHGEEFGHSLGHGVGLAVHEGPRLGPGSPDILQRGMVFSIEPGIYIPGWGGVRIEDLATIEDGRVKVLSSAPKQGPLKS